MVVFSKECILHLKEHFNLNEMLSPLVPDWISVEEALLEMGEYDYFEILDESGNPLGFFMYEVVGDSVETHAFIPVANRNRSMEILRAFRGHLTDTLGFNRIYTTVSGNFKYIVKVLNLIGFKTFNVESCVVSKNCKLYDLFHMEYIKE